MRFSTSVVIAGAVFGLSQLIAPAAQAVAYDNMFPTNPPYQYCTSGNMGDTFCQTDNAGVTYFAQSSIGTIGRNNIIDNADGQLDPTDLNTTYDSTPVYTGPSETDIIYQQSNDVPDGFVGVTWCDSATDLVACDQEYVRTIAGNPSHALICHESGHAVGLTHGSNADPPINSSDPSLACMRTPLTSDTTLGAHNVSEINATY